MVNIDPFLNVCLCMCKNIDLSINHGGTLQYLDNGQKDIDRLEGGMNDLHCFFTLFR